MERIQILILFSVLSVVIADQFKLSTVTFDEVPECLGTPDHAEGYKKIGKNYYALRTNKTSWINALSNCAEEGARLASIETLEELNAIDAELKSIGLSDWIWVASMDVLSVGNFRWIGTGKKIESSFWSANQPDYPDVEHCVHLWPKGPNGIYRLNNWECDKTLYYLCQKKGPKAVAISIWP